MALLEEAICISSSLRYYHKPVISHHHYSKLTLHTEWSTFGSSIPVSQYICFLMVFVFLANKKVNQERKKVEHLTTNGRMRWAGGGGGCWDKPRWSKGTVVMKKLGTTAITVKLSIKSLNPHRDIRARCCQHYSLVMEPRLSVRVKTTFLSGPLSAILQ